MLSTGSHAVLSPNALLLSTSERRAAVITALITGGCPDRLPDTAPIGFSGVAGLLSGYDGDATVFHYFPHAGNSSNSFPTPSFSADIRKAVTHKCLHGIAQLFRYIDQGGVSATESGTLHPDAQKL